MSSKKEIDNAKSNMPMVFDLEDITEKVVYFCEVLSGITFYPYQKEYAMGIVRSLLANDGEEVTALFARQSGKSEVNACVASGCMVIVPKLAEMFPDYEPIQTYKDGLWVGIFAPSNEQASTTHGRARQRIKSYDAKLILEDAELQVGLKTTGGNIRLTNGSFCVGQSANKTAHIESKTYHLIIVEEAQDADDKVVKKSIHPMGASTNATIIKTGTANDRKSDFFDAIKRNRRKNLKGSKKYHYQYNYRVVQKYNKRYRQFIQREMERLGKDSDEFRMSYGCEFILERGMFITEEKFNELLDINPNLPLCYEKREGNQVAGIDIGKRIDPTVVTILDVDWDNPIILDEKSGMMAYRKKILDWKEIMGDNHERQFYEIIEYLNSYNIRVIYIDSTGKGDPVADRFQAFYMGEIEVVPYNFSTQSKSKMWKVLDQEIRANRIEIPNGSRVERLKKWQKFKQQMIDLEKSWRGTYMICNHPQEKGAHDDYPDSLGLAVLASEQDLMPEIEVGNNDFYDRTPKGHKPYNIGRKNLFG